MAIESTPVNGIFFQGAQPVTVVSLPLPAGSSTSAKQPSLGTAGTASTDVITVQGIASMTPLKTDSSGVTQPVSGTFFQATQPVSISALPALSTGSAIVGKVGIDQTTPGTTNLVQVGGTLPAFASTPTIIANAGTNLNTSALALDATLTGGAQQTKITDGTTVATVKAASTAAIATDKSLVVAVSPNNTVAVTGAFFQGTQPISGTVTANSGTNLNTSNLDVALSTRLKPADTLAGVTTVAAVTAITNALPTGANSIGQVTSNAGTNTSTANLDVALSTRLKPADTLTGVTTVGTVTSITNAIPLPTLTKGTQAATGISVQNLKDAGRNQTNFFQAIQIVSTNTDTLMSLTGYKSGAAVVATTTPAVVTAGKIYRLNSITMDYTTIVTTPGSVRFTLRANLSGTVAIGSPAVCIWEVGEPTGIAPVAGKKNTVTLSFPDGIEFAAGTGVGISMIGLNTVGAAAAVGYGRISINGYEY